MSEHKSGFVSFVGRPNAGKSTLTNALVGTEGRDHQRQAADHPHRGARHRAPARRPADPGRHPGPAPAAHPARRAAQRPGAHHLGRGRRGRRVLPLRREDRARATGSSSPSWPRCSRTTKVAIATKTDLATPERIGAAPARHPGARRRRPAPTGPRSCRCRRVAGDQVSLLEDLLVGLLPEGPQLYPDGDLTDAPEEILVAELIREAALDGVRDELPHSIAVVVEEMGLREGRPEDKPLLDIHANLYVERSSQKGIVIGHEGARLRRSAPPPASRSRRCSARRSTSTCTSRSPRTGSATRGSCASWASSRRQLGWRTGSRYAGRDLVPRPRSYSTSVRSRSPLVPRATPTQAPSTGRTSCRRSTAAAVGHS